MNITFIVGLPGSGKSYLAKKIKTNSCIIDDPKSLDKDIFPYLNMKKDLIIIDANFCFTELLERAIMVLKNKIEETVEINIIYFKNDPKQCIKNVERRKENGDIRDVISSIEILTKEYKIPNNVTAMEVWRE